ncbi:MAG: mitochondrial fission ELM1 family protein [Halioglobus sp.]
MTQAQPIVWCLLGKKAGDNTQVLALADELGWQCERKTILARASEILVHLGHRATLSGIDIARSSALQAPWPDLVISAGRRNEPVAQWIRAQSAGKTRLVHVGRPWAPLDQWDLIVTTPQYFLPQQVNVHHNQMPLLRLPKDSLRAAGEDLLPQLESLPRPWVAVLMGGDSGKYVMTAEKGKRLGSLATDLAVAAEGSLLATDSPRTPKEAGDAMQAELHEPNYCYRFHTRGTDGENNPYLGLLALADAFIVTGESMSMLAEACATGRPVFVFDVGDGDTPWWMLLHNYRVKPLSFHLGRVLGPRRMRRDIGRIQEALVGSDQVQWLDSQVVYQVAEQLKEATHASPSQQALSDSIAQRELAATADAVRQLLATSR